MTWKEFKNSVERQLKALNLSEDTKIWYIDYHSTDIRFDEIEVEYKKDSKDIAIF
jgi:hypothetical protein